WTPWARKKTAPAKIVNSDGDEPFGPAVMSFTNTVPAAVPSLFQSSAPVDTVRAAKKISLPNRTNPDGLEDWTMGTALMSLTRNGRWAADLADPSATTVAASAIGNARRTARCVSSTMFPPLRTRERRTGKSYRATVQSVELKFRAGARRVTTAGRCTCPF